MGDTQGARGAVSNKPHSGDDGGAVRNWVDGDSGGVTSSKLPQELRGESTVEMVVEAVYEDIVVWGCDSEV